MALSFTEKRGLQKDVQNCLVELGGQPDFRTKRSLQKQLAEALAKLNAGNAPKTDNLLDRFLAEEFTQATPIKMYSIFHKVYAAANNQLDLLKDALGKFLDWHNAQGNNRMAAGVMESASLLHYDYSNAQVMEQLLSFMSSGRAGSITISLD